MKPWAVAVVAAALGVAWPAVALRIRSSESTAVGACPSMFVAIFSREDAAEQRSLLREMWVGVDTLFERSDADAGAQGDMIGKAMVNGWANLVANFVICTSNGQTPKALEKEASDFGDLLFLDCEEGYGHGLLTRKTLATMRAFRSQFSDQELFMKVDDDTFVARRRLCDTILTSTGDGNHDALAHSYMGVVTPKAGEALPHREQDSKFYEPPEVYPNATYPRSMEGGPGYILGRELVEKMLDKKIPGKNMLWVEDKAVGVWVNKLEDQGVKVNWVDIPGTDGYSIWQDHGRWGDYPYILRHHLTGRQISCLERLAEKDDKNAPVDGCFGDSNTW